MLKTFKYRIYPTKREANALNEHLAICSELYNAALQERRDAWRLERKSITYFDQTLQLKHIKPDRPDVASVPTTALENTLKRVDLAFKAFFRRVRTGEKPGFPRFRSAQRYDSLTFRNIGNALKGNRLRLSKIGKVRIKLHRPLAGQVKTLTIQREVRHWFALFACEVEPQPLPFNPSMIGIDVGLTHFATLSDGTEIINPRYYRKAQRALRVAQRRVARRKRGSQGRRDAVALLQRANSSVQRQRADFHHNLSRSLVNANGLIAAENLNIKGMARSNLAKSIFDAGWAQFMNMIAYKAESAGRVFVQVNPNGTSQTCTCGADVRKTLSQRWHSCLACGLSLPRDHVSAQIVLGRAVRLRDSTWAAAPCVS